MSINLDTLFTSLGIVGGNTSAKNQYEFYDGIFWNDATITYNQKEFFDKIGLSRYDFFKQYGSEKQFYSDIDDVRITDYKSFYQYAGEYVNPDAPIVSFSADSVIGNTDTIITFTNTTTGGTPITYAWDFGDGTTSTDTNPTHSYSTPNTYTIALTASNSFGTGSEVKSSYITIGDIIVASFSVDNSDPQADEVVTFTDTSTGNPDTWSWDFGDGTTSTDTNPTHSYSATGSYVVSMTASSPYDIDSTSTGIEVLPSVPPTANFTVNATQSFINTTYTFTNTTTGTEPITYTWDFGDGSTSTDANPTHSYSSTGSYTIALTASNDFGVDGEIKANYITIVDMVVASFSSSTQSTTPDTVITFTDTSTGNPDTWSWDFGDGNIDVVQNPTHSYSGTGSFVVSMTASSPYDTDSTSDVIEVVDVEPFSLSGGTVTTSGGDDIHTFTTDGTLTVTGEGTATILVIGGGAGSNKTNTSNIGGGGGSGGQAVATSVALSAGTYNIVIGPGGVGAVSTYGGAGGQSYIQGVATASGGNANATAVHYGNNSGVYTGSANFTSTYQRGGSGAGSSGNGLATTAAPTNGILSSISGTEIGYAGGANGGVYNGTEVGSGGVSAYGAGRSGGTSVGENAPANRGGGGGGSGKLSTTVRNGANGGSGVVILRYTPA